MLLKEDGCSLQPWQCSLTGTVSISAPAELSETFKNASGANPCECRGGEGAGSGGAAAFGWNRWGWEARASSSQVAHCHLAGICLFPLQTKFPWHCAARMGGKHPWCLETPRSCCCHRGAKGEATARGLEAAGENSSFPGSCLFLSAHSRPWSNSTKPSFCTKHTFPSSPASFLPPPQQLCWGQTPCRRSPALSSTGQGWIPLPGSPKGPGRAEGAQHNPADPHSQHWAELAPCNSQ